MNTTIAMTNAPNANDPSCFKDLHIDLEIGDLGCPSSKYQIATDEQVQYIPIAYRKKPILNNKMLTKVNQIYKEWYRFGYYD